MVNFFNKSLAYVIYLSPPISRVYAPNRHGKFNDLIPLGIKKEVNKTLKLPNGVIRLGFIGIIREQQGLDLMFSYLSQSNICHLDIVGNGYSLPYYKSLASDLNINDKIKFHGKVDDISQIFRSWDIGVALYEDSPYNLSRFCEPTKIKHYLSFGIPVITTKTTYFSSEIKKYKAGLVVDETIESIDKAIKGIKKRYPDYIKGVNELVKKYEYTTWYEKKFKFLE